MNSGIDDLLGMVDQWKFKLHAKLKKLTPAKRRVFWNQIHEDARKMGLRVAEPEGTAKPSPKGARGTR